MSRFYQKDTLCEVELLVGFFGILDFGIRNPKLDEVNIRWKPQPIRNKRVDANF